MHTGFRWGEGGRERGGERERGERERDHLKDLGVDGKIILKWLFRKWDGGLHWINVMQDRDKWMGLVNAVMNFRTL